MIYLDNSATTALCERAKQKMIEAMDCFGNPSSLHSVGYDASVMLDGARSAVASSLGLRRGSGYEIVFTGSGTEANNLALLGTARAKQRITSRRIITTDSEHPSVMQPLAYLEAHGFEIVKIPTRGGVLDMQALERALEGGALMISLMLVNNETGARYDVEKAFAAARRRCPDIVTHCDATQGYMKMPVTPMRLGADLITVSAHKIHGPKGVGALCIAPDIIKTKRLVAVTRGGGQEKALRSGTENMIGIAGFWGAVEQNMPNCAKNAQYMSELRDYAESLLHDIEGVRLNIPEGARAPHIISITLPDIKSETMVHFLSSRGIAISAGSACSSHNAHVSESLIGFGIDRHAAMCTVRVSLCDENTKEHMDALADALRDGIGTLVRIRK
ncbi:MAG: cysteine desulfurase [Clostridia bacterium]|nr:cysteine desulfurase [Clostridia bacterium]